MLNSFFGAAVLYLGSSRARVVLWLYKGSVCLALLCLVEWFGDVAACLGSREGFTAVASVVGTPAPVAPLRCAVLRCCPLHATAVLCRTGAYALQPHDVEVSHMKYCSTASQ